MNLAVFLDRDGVINETLVRDGLPYSPLSAQQVRVPADVPQALQSLKQEGFLLLVVTNQPNVARGRLTPEAVEGIHRHLSNILPIDAFRICFHDDKDKCLCRKPEPGMLMSLAAEYQVDLPNSYMVGDRLRDIEAGSRAGCATVFIDHGYAVEKPDQPSAIVHSMSEAAQWIITDHHGKSKL